jgi:hypothetical protein
MPFPLAPILNIFLLGLAAAQPECPPARFSGVPSTHFGNATLRAPVPASIYSLNWCSGTTTCNSPVSSGAQCLVVNRNPIPFDSSCVVLASTPNLAAAGVGSVKASISGAPATAAQVQWFAGASCSGNPVFTSTNLPLSPLGSAPPSSGCQQPSSPAAPAGSSLYATGTLSAVMASTSVRITANAVEFFSPDGRLEAGGMGNSAQHRRFCVQSAVSVAAASPGGSAYALLAAGRTNYFAPVEDTTCLASSNYTSVWLRVERYVPASGGGAFLALGISAYTISVAAAPDHLTPPTAFAPMLAAEPFPWVDAPSSAAWPTWRCPPPAAIGGSSGPGVNPPPLREGAGTIARATLEPPGSLTPQLPPLFAYLYPGGQGAAVGISGGWLGALKGLTFDDGPGAPLLLMEGDCIKSYQWPDASSPNRAALSLGGAVNAKCAAVTFDAAPGLAAFALPAVAADGGRASAAACGTRPAPSTLNTAVIVRDFSQRWASASPSPSAPPPPAPSPAPWAAVDDFACPPLPPASAQFAAQLSGASSAATFPSDAPPCPGGGGPCPSPPPPEPAVLSFAPATGVSWYSPSRKSAVAYCPASIAPWTQDPTYFVLEAPLSALAAPISPWAPTCRVLQRRCFLVKIAGGTLYGVANTTFRTCDAFYAAANFTRGASAPPPPVGPAWVPGATPPPPTHCDAANVPALLRGHGWAANTTTAPAAFYDPTGKPNLLVFSAWGTSLASPQGFNGSALWRQCATAPALDVGSGGLGPWVLTISAYPLGPEPAPAGAGGRCYLIARSGDDLTVTEGPPAPGDGAACGAPTTWGTSYAPFTYAGFYSVAAGGAALQAWPSLSPTPSGTPSTPPSPTGTPTPTVSLGATASNSGSISGTGTGTASNSGTGSNSLSPTAALSPGASASATPTPTATLSTGATASASPTPSTGGGGGAAAAAASALVVQNAVGGTFGFLLIAGAIALGVMAWRRAAAGRAKPFAKSGPAAAGAAVVQLNPLAGGAVAHASAVEMAPAASQPPPLAAAPAAPPPAAAAAPLPPGWIEQHDGTDVWYVDTATGESHWELPGA